LTDAIEVQLAALKAGISFWSEWVEHTAAFVQSASKTLSTINSDEQNAKDLVLELVDAGRASVRALTEIPRHTATRFIEELDKLEQENAAQAARAARRGAERAARQQAGGRDTKPAGSRGRSKRRPTRAGRVKA
jgi:hypothetical protein